MWQEIVNAAAPLFVLLVGALFTRLTVAIVQRMGVGAGRDAMVELAQVAEHVVLDVGANVRPALVSTGGRPTKENAKLLSQTALDAIKDSLSKAALAQLKKNSTDPDAVIRRAIEGELEKAKASLGGTKLQPLEVSVAAAEVQP